MYETFARVYDEFMQQIPAARWADYAEALWKHFCLKPELVLDLCCGTGSVTLELCRRGYDMIGIDASAQMLSRAREKTAEAGYSDKILYVQQDMREFELYGTVDSILCTCDSLNYLSSEQELLQVFMLAENYLGPGGLLLFDLNTEYTFSRILSDNTFADTTDDAAFIWQNYYYEKEKINEYQVTFFRKDPDSGLYERSQETHYEKAFDPLRVEQLLEQAHLKPEGIFETFRLEPAAENSERITFAAREYRAKRTS